MAEVSSLRDLEELRGYTKSNPLSVSQQEAIAVLSDRGQLPIDYKYGGDTGLAGPFIGERRPILRQEQSMIVGYNSDGSAIIETIPAQYGPSEFDSSYSPARRGLSKLNDVFFGDANEQSAALSGITEALRAVPEYLKGQYDAGMGGGTVFNPETQQIQEFDPTAVMLGGAPAGLKAVRNIPSNQVILGTMGSKTAKYTPDQRRAMDELESQGMDTENLFLHGTSDDIRQPSSWKTGYRDSGWIGEGFYGATPDGSRISDFYANTAAPRFRNEAGDYSYPNVFPYITKRGNYKQYSLMDKAGMGIVAQINPDYSKNLTQKNIDEGFIGAEVIDGEGQIVERVNYFPDTDTRSALNYDTTDLASNAVKAGGNRARFAVSRVLSDVTEAKNKLSARGITGPDAEEIIEDVTQTIMDGNEIREVWGLDEEGMELFEMVEDAIRTKPEALSSGGVKYQWMRNAEGGQTGGNKQSVVPFTEDLFNEVRDEGSLRSKTYEEYRRKFPEVTHISVIDMADGTRRTGAIGSLDDLRPPQKHFDNGWVIETNDFDSPEALLQLQTADSDLVKAGGNRVRSALNELGYGRTPNQSLNSIPFIHNTDPNTLKGSGKFGTSIEPAGQYVSPTDKLRTDFPENFIAGEKEFSKPLVINFGDGYDKPNNWKNRLSAEYDNKTGIDLTNALRADGYDGIVTVDEGGNLSEMVDLTQGKSGSALSGLELNIDQGARMQRAQEGGFDTERTAYRGLSGEYDPNKAGNYQMFTSSPEDAGEYGSNVVSSYLRKGNNLVVDGGRNNFNSIPVRNLPDAVRANLHSSVGSVARTDDIAYAAQAAGYDSVSINNVFDKASNEIPLKPLPASNAPMSQEMIDLLDEVKASGITDGLPPYKFAPEIPKNYDPTTIDIIFDPKDIRSINAEFDPAKADSSDLLSSISPTQSSLRNIA